tara:strand:+ start:268 stop:615 length:348 start_codon:yes stop_codon:yes gene_type:complete
MEYYDPFRPKSVKKKSTADENRIAKEFGGHRQPASGAISGLKGDVITESFLIEHKFTEKGSFSITRGLLSKIVREAYGEGRVPLLCIKFDSTPAGLENEWVLIPKGEFLEMTDGS